MTPGEPPELVGPGTDRAVRAWQARPLVWFVGLALLAALFLADEAAVLRSHEPAGRVVRVSGEVLSSWDGDRLVPVRYWPADRGDAVRATAFVPEGTDLAVGPVELQVGDAPEIAAIVGVGRSSDLVGMLAFVVPGLLAVLAWWGARRWCVRRSRRLLARPGPGYAMVGVARHGRIARRRWHLDLYAVDARPGSAPVASVPVIAGDRWLVARPVVVHGTPRPGGVVVPVDAAGHPWWPAGRASLGARRPLPPPEAGRTVRPRGRWRWLPLALGVVLLVISVGADDPDASVERSQRIEAEVTEGRGAGVGPVLIAYEWEGRTYRTAVRLAGPQVAGDAVERQLDPEHPERTWQPGTEYPPSGRPWVGDLFGVSIALIWLGTVWAGEPRGWDGRPLI